MYPWYCNLRNILTNQKKQLTLHHCHSDGKYLRHQCTPLAHINPYWHARPYTNNTLNDPQGYDDGGDALWYNDDDDDDDDDDLYN